MNPPRLILYHKQSTSARTRFLRLGHGGMCGPEPLPADAVLSDEADPSATVVSHPAPLIRAAESRLGLSAGSLEAETGFRCRITSAQGPSEVFLARFRSTDPPFDTVAAQGGAFIDLTQARGLPTVELELLRRAYELILG
jgi:hypothetical protein